MREKEPGSLMKAYPVTGQTIKQIATINANHVEVCLKLRTATNCTSATQHCNTSCHPSVSCTVLHSPATFYTSLQRLKLTNFLTLKNSWLIFFFGGFMSRILCNLNKKPQILHMHRILKTFNHTTGNFNSSNV